MANQHQMPPEARSPRAVATRGELYFGLFLIWLFLAFVFGELLQSEHSWPRLIYWVVSLLMVAMYAVIVVGMWWVAASSVKAELVQPSAGHLARPVPAFLGRYGETMAATRWYAQLHPAIVCFSYAGFIFFGGFWNWVFRGAVPTFVAASAFAGLMLIPSVLCLGVRNDRVGAAGIYTGLVFSALIAVVYSWRAYLALFDQSNLLKFLLIATQVALGVLVCLLLFANRHYGRRAPGEPDSSIASG